MLPPDPGTNGAGTMLPTDPGTNGEEKATTVARATMATTRAVRITENTPRLEFRRWS